MRLNEILSTMDVPAWRTNLDNLANVRWLLRNIHINNKNHPNLEEAIQLLKQEVPPICWE